MDSQYENWKSWYIDIYKGKIGIYVIEEGFYFSLYWICIGIIDYHFRMVKQ